MPKRPWTGPTVLLQSMQCVAPRRLSPMDFVQQLRLQGHPRFPEYTIAQCYSDPLLSDQPDFPELNRLDHFSSHGFRSGALLDSDSDSTEEFSDARSQPGELQSPVGQQTRNLSPNLSPSNLGRCAQLYDAFHFALQSRVRDDIVCNDTLAKRPRGLFICLLLMHCRNFWLSTMWSWLQLHWSKLAPCPHLV